MSVCGSYSYDCAWYYNTIIDDDTVIRLPSSDTVFNIIIPDIIIIQLLSVTAVLYYR